MRHPGDLCCAATSAPVMAALKCSGPSVTLDQRKASTEGSSTCSVRLNVCDCLMTLPSLRSVSPPSFPASELPSPSLPASRKDLSVAAWLNSGLGGGSSAARLVPVEAEPLLLLLLAHAAICTSAGRGSIKYKTIACTVDRS